MRLGKETEVEGERGRKGERKIRGRDRESVGREGGEQKKETVTYLNI